MGLVLWGFRLSSGLEISEALLEVPRQLHVAKTKSWPDQMYS